MVSIISSPHSPQKVNNFPQSVDGRTVGKTGKRIWLHRENKTSVRAVTDTRVITRDDSYFTGSAGSLALPVSPSGKGGLYGSKSVRKWSVLCLGTSSS